MSVGSSEVGNCDGCENDGGREGDVVGMDDVGDLDGKSVVGNFDGEVLGNEDEGVSEGWSLVGFLLGAKLGLKDGEKEGPVVGLVVMASQSLGQMPVFKTSEHSSHGLHCVPNGEVTPVIGSGCGLSRRIR